jgi:hypothetical protein
MESGWAFAIPTLDRSPVIIVGYRWLAFRGLSYAGTVGPLWGQCILRTGHDGLSSEQITWNGIQTRGTHMVTHCLSANNLKGCLFHGLRFRVPRKTLLQGGWGEKPAEIGR